MSDEVNESVNEETSLQQQETHEQEAQSQSEKQDDNNQSYNWSKMRKTMQELERQKKELEERVASLTQPKHEPEQDEFADDDYVEGKYVKELKKELKELKSYIQEQTVSSVEDRLQLKYQDFNDVVSKENIETLLETEPELASSLKYISDPYKQGVAAYKMLKKFGFGATAPEPSFEKQKAKANTQKPVSVNALGKGSAIGNAHLFENGLTPELKKQLWQEMNNARKQA